MVSGTLWSASRELSQWDTNIPKAEIRKAEDELDEWMNSMEDKFKKQGFTSNKKVVKYAFYLRETITSL